MSKKRTIEVVFFEDLTFTVEVAIAPAEPDVGIMSCYIDEWEIKQVDQCKDKSVLEFFTNKVQGKPNISPWSDMINDKLSEDTYDE